MKKSVGIIIGGKSVEHEVSIITGLQVLDNIDRNLFDPKVIYIDKEGKWFLGESLHDIKNYKNKTLNDIYEVVLGAKNNKLVLYPNPDTVKQGLFAKKIAATEIDIVLPAVHGTNVEDGALHGFFQMNNIPCAFGSVLSSAVGMDKIIMKKVYKNDGLPVVDYIDFYSSQWNGKKETIIGDAEALGYPLIVKPANLGSSIGISKANNKDELLKSIEVAMSYDRKIIIEKCVQNLREINCAVLGYEDDLIASVCEEPLGWQDFLKFEDKYVSKSKSGSNEKRQMPADLSPEVTKQIQEYAKKAFQAIDCSGTARIDFLYDGNNIYVNEINTIPGSIAFYLWEATGISFKDLISKIIQIAEVQQKEKVNNITTYDVDLLNKMAKNGKHN